MLRPASAANRRAKSLPPSDLPNGLSALLALPEPEGRDSPLPPVVVTAPASYRTELLCLPPANMLAALETFSRLVLADLMVSIRHT